MSYLLLVVGFVLLIKGADWFVEGSSNVAKFFKIPSFIIGVTLVALGTSLPELSVSVTAAIKQSSDLSVSNIIGSNLFNLFIVLGLTCVIKPIETEKNIVNKDYKLSIYVLLLLLGIILVYNYVGKVMMLGRVGGAILLFALMFYLIDLIIGAEKEKSKVKIKLTFKDFVFVILGVLMIMFGGRITVNSATDIARSLKMSERLIGLTVVALGTSLPELCTSIIAALKGENEIAVGNVIGSNLLNVLFILGLSSVISPMVLNIKSVIDIMLLSLGSIGVLLFILNDYKISRKEGVAMILYYLIYTVYIFTR